MEFSLSLTVNACVLLNLGPQPHPTLTACLQISDSVYCCLCEIPTTSLTLFASEQVVRSTTKIITCVPKDSAKTQTGFVREMSPESS